MTFSRDKFSFFTRSGCGRFVQHIVNDCIASEYKGYELHGIVIL